MAVIVDTYRKLKRQQPDRLVLFETGKVALFLCEDAEDVSRLLAEPISTQHVIGRPAVVFAQARLNEVLTRLTVFCLAGLELPFCVCVMGLTVSV